MLVPLSGSSLPHLYQKNTPNYFMRAQLSVPGSKKVILIHPGSLSTSPSFHSPNCTFLLTCPGPPARKQASLSRGLPGLPLPLMVSAVGTDIQLMLPEQMNCTAERLT